MDAKSIGRAGLQGWRAKVADVVAQPVAKRSPLADDDVRAVVGALFLVLSIVYVATAIRRIAQGG
jgi:hypothetical protein